MRITILTFGSRGDVEPLVALGVGLGRAGHTVTVAASPNFAPMIWAVGLAFAPVPADIRAVIAGPLKQPSMGLHHQALQFSIHAFKTTRALVAQSLQAYTQACQDADLIVFPWAVPWGYAIAQNLGKRCIQVVLQPAYPTGDFPAPGAPQLPLFQAAYNRWTHFIAEQWIWQMVRGPINCWRTHTLGLAPWPALGPWQDQRAAHLPVLHGYSPRVVPHPADWPPWVHVTGYWWLGPPVWTPPPALAAFLAAGPPPVYVGFGSMADPDPLALTALVVRALALAGQRGVLLTGWGGLVPTADEHVLFVDDVPHSVLLPHMAAAVHHGGAGTTGAALRAGLPSLIVPFLSADQPFWGQRLEALGVGQLMLRKQLTAERLAAAITKLTDEGIRNRAAELGRHLCAEDGVGNALAAVERYAG